MNRPNGQFSKEVVRWATNILVFDTLSDQENINNYFQLGVVGHTFNPLRPCLKKKNQPNKKSSYHKKKLKVNFEIQSHPS